MGGHAEAFPGQPGGQRPREDGPPRGDGLSGIGIQGIALQVGTQVHGPGIREHERLCEGQIAGALVVMQVIGQRHGILLRVGVVMNVVVREFETERRRVTGRPVFLPTALEEEVAVRLPLRTEREAHRPADDRTGESPLRAVAISAKTPFPPLEAAEQGRLQAEAPDIPVFPHQGGIEKGKLVFSMTGHPLRRYPERDGTQIPVPLEGRIEGSERTPSQTHPSPIPVHQQGRLALQVNRSSGRILFRRLQTSGFLSVIQGHQADSVHRETPQVHLHVLRIVHLDTVQEHADMLASQTADIHRLQSPYPSIILHLDTGKPAEDVCDLRRRSGHARKIHFLGGPDDREHLDGIDGGRRERIRLLGLQAPGGGQGDGQRYG